MATKIRLARHGRKAKPFYHIVVADSRAPRDGRFIEKLGTYNPNTNPATIEIDFDSAVSWIEKGAQPTDTTKAILSYQGALLRVHLNKGVKKGALTQEQADAKFEAWKQEKTNLVDSKISGLDESKANKAKAALEAEELRRKSIQERVEAKLAPPVEEVEEVVAETTEEIATEETVEATADAVEEVAAPETESTSEAESTPEVESAPEAESTPEAEATEEKAE